MESTARVCHSDLVEAFDRTEPRLRSPERNCSTTLTSILEVSRSPWHASDLQVHSTQDPGAYSQNISLNPGYTQAGTLTKERLFVKFSSSGSALQIEAAQMHYYFASFQGVTTNSAQQRVEDVAADVAH